MSCIGVMKLHAASHTCAKNRSLSQRAGRLSAPRSIELRSPGHPPFFTQNEHLKLYYLYTISNVNVSTDLMCASVIKSWAAAYVRWAGRCVTCAAAHSLLLLHHHLLYQL